MHDAVIVGAGPGGSATAHFLGEHGVDVLLVDRAEFPRDKTCGDGLTPRALRVLDRMGMLDEVRRAGCEVRGYEVVAPNGQATTAPMESGPGGLVIPRQRLDEMILRRAITSGARFESKVAVTHVEPTSTGVRVHAQDGRRLDARVAVVATGAATGVARRSGILRRPPRAMLAARAYFHDLPRPVPGTFQLRFDHVPMPGYGWIFPVASHAANVGVGFLPRGRRRPTAVEAFQPFVNGAAVSRLLTGGRQVGPVKGYPIRIDFRTSPTYGERTLLVGEAAGLVNPLTGEGIDYALESGMLAARHILAGLSAGTDAAWLADYDRLLRARFERMFHFSEWVRDWYCWPPAVNLLVPLGNRHPELRRHLARLVLGEREPRGYGPVSMLVRLMLYLVQHRGATTRD